MRRDRNIKSSGNDLGASILNFHLNKRLDQVTWAVKTIAERGWTKASYDMCDVKLKIVFRAI